LSYLDFDISLPVAQSSLYDPLEIFIRQIVGCAGGSHPRIERTVNA
jgi:hypothetical protein